ncbi:MAG: hypothetical protein R3B93_00965 [Bacteroidia bacterium]
MYPPCYRRSSRPQGETYEPIYHKDNQLPLPLFLLPPPPPAQCDPELQSTRADIEARRYQRAITKLLIIQKECPQVSDKVAAMIQETFALIEGERNRADSALAVAERVLDQMYFYEGKFGLTLKNIAKKGFLQSTVMVLLIEMARR